ncbi:MAG: HU family DNA-binding protein [Terracidiphilus sp.]
MSGSLCGEPNAKKLGRRAHLVQRLMDEQDLSRRKATEIVNVILERMIAALKRDHEVEFPLGKLKVVPHHHRMQEGKFLDLFERLIVILQDRGGFRRLLVRE